MKYFSKKKMREIFLKDHPDFDLNETPVRKVKEGFCKFCGMRLIGYHTEFPCDEYFFSQNIV